MRAGGRFLTFGMLASLLLATACRDESKPVEPPAPPEVRDDPVLAVTVPGAYGVEGGNEVVSDGVQTSLLTYPEGRSWRLLKPLSRKVVSLSALPESFRQGERIQFLYRVSERGIIRVNHTFTDVEVLQVTDSLVWLKRDEHTFFVLEP